MAHGPQQRSYKIQQNLQNNLGVEISKDDPTTIYELQERLGKVSAVCANQFFILQGFILCLSVKLNFACVGFIWLRL
jgi:hypothetical protein